MCNDHSLVRHPLRWAVALPAIDTVYKQQPGHTGSGNDVWGACSTRRVGLNLHASVATETQFQMHRVDRDDGWDGGAEQPLVAVLRTSPAARH
jgi:hypothetical protein